MKVFSLLLLMAGLAAAPSLAPAESVRMLSRGDQSLAARLLALKGAKHSIDIIAHELSPCDASAKAIIGVLVEKARKIPVRVLLDDYVIEQDEKRGLADYFAANNIQFKIYNTFFLNANHRSHIKLFLIDGATASPTYFADSSNLTDQYFGMSAGKNFVNRDFMIRGKSGRQAKVGFDRLWNSRSSDEIRVSSNGAAFYHSCIKSNARDIQVLKYLNKNAKKLAAAREVNCPNATYLADDPKFQSQAYSETGDRGGPQEEYMNEMRLRKKQATAGMLAFMTGTKHTLNMENQYYLPAHKLRDALDDLRERGVRILVLTNRSADATETFSPIVSHFSLRAARRDSGGAMNVLPLASRGAMRTAHKLSVGNGPWHLHSKTAVRDHKDVFVSSFNLDPRSYHTNLEYGVVFKNCPALAKQVEADYQRMVEIYAHDLERCKACRSENPNLNPMQWMLGVLAGSFL